MSNEQKKSIPPLQTITANTLLNTDYPPLAFSIEKLLPQGIFILAGSGKIGKSWLSLDMCIAVSTGGKLWGFNAYEGEVLYLALEDTHPRLKERLERIQGETENTEKLHLAISSLGITDGLIEQIKAFISANPNTRLIVIDTLERIRNSEQDKSMYSCDYRDINKLREALEGNTATLLLVHHTRKMYDPDPLNTLSGSTGLVGAVDGVWVLEKEKRTEGKGKLTIANRDTEGYCFKVEFDKENCRWNFIGIDNGKITSETDEKFCHLIHSFVNEQWQGTATQLVDYLKQMDRSLDIAPRSISRKLESVSDQLKSSYGIDFKANRTSKGKSIYLCRES
ncbi:AAA family ATPase [Anaerotignum sp.]|uniref:AAA family ATPase n=1 Tax=Anaerotignum sp. TaxID=2039241 RepID=UPI0028AA1F17|nr:AAA family ATPase [Anaerotignum sp.]